MMVIIIYCY